MKKRVEEWEKIGKRGVPAASVVVRAPAEQYGNDRAQIVVIAGLKGKAWGEQAVWLQSSLITVVGVKLPIDIFVEKVY